jgi:hypothetical protein
MKLYYALCENENLRRSFSEIINQLIENPIATQERLKLQSRNVKEPLTAHALRILATLSEKNDDNKLISQFRDATLKLEISEPIDAFVFQVMLSDRWLKHDQKYTYDLILAVPILSKTIAISATEAEISMDPIIPRLAKVSLDHVHLYSFFNRAHAVKGRRITSKESKEITFAQLKPFMRTCNDIEIIGKGVDLPFLHLFLQTMD